ncbi:MAG: phage protein GemA/Gp16 family protein [Brevinema sp.]
MNHIQKIPDDSHKKCIRAIHILKNKLGLSDKNYRALLQESFHKQSSKDLTPKQQSQLIALLNSQYLSTQQANQSNYKQHNYILFLAKDKIIDLFAYCSKIVNRSISHLQELTKQEASNIINSLKRYHRE